MVFLILDKEDKKIFNSEDPDKTEAAQKLVDFHPSYNCFWLLDEEGLLQLENSCGEFRGVSDRFEFLAFIPDEKYDQIK